MTDIYEKVKEFLSNDEMHALWRHHHEAELKAADNGEYDDAKYHKERKTMFYRQPSTPP